MVNGTAAITDAPHATFDCGDDRTPVAHLFAANDPAAAALLELEAAAFTDAPQLFDNSADGLFHLIAITTHGRVRHVARVSAPATVGGHPNSIAFLITDLADAYDIDVDTFAAHYRDSDGDITAAVSVETQVRLGDQLEPVRSADLLYLALFQVVKSYGGQSIAAHLNTAAIRSFARFGMAWEPFAGRDDLRTPTVTADGTAGFDDDYRPVWIPYARNAPLFESLMELAPTLVDHTRNPAR